MEKTGVLNDGPSRPRAAGVDACAPASTPHPPHTRHPDSPDPSTPPGVTSSRDIHRGTIIVPNGIAVSPFSLFSSQNHSEKQAQSKPRGAGGAVLTVNSYPCSPQTKVGCPPSGPPFRPSVSDESVRRACREAGHRWRERQFGPAETVHLFVLQSPVVLHRRDTTSQRSGRRRRAQLRREKLRVLPPRSGRPGRPRGSRSGWGRRAEPTSPGRE